jgi:hypothetical protein
LKRTFGLLAFFSPEGLAGLRPRPFSCTRVDGPPKSAVHRALWQNGTATNPFFFFDKSAPF